MPTSQISPSLILDRTHLLNVLSRLPHTKLWGNCEKGCGLDTYRSQLTVYLDFEDTLNIEERAKLTDNIARFLGSSDSYRAYEAIVEINWIGNKGIDNINTPFMCITIQLEGIETIANLLEEYLVGYVDNNVRLQKRKVISPTLAIATTSKMKRG